MKVKLKNQMMVYLTVSMMERLMDYQKAISINSKTANLMVAMKVEREGSLVVSKVALMELMMVDSTVLSMGSIEAAIKESLTVVMKDV